MLLGKIALCSLSFHLVTIMVAHLSLKRLHLEKTQVSMRWQRQGSDQLSVS